MEPCERNQVFQIEIFRDLKKIKDPPPPHQEEKKEEYKLMVSTDAITGKTSGNDCLEKGTAGQGRV